MYLTGKGSWAACSEGAGMGLGGRGNGMSFLGSVGELWCFQGSAAAWGRGAVQWNSCDLTPGAPVPSHPARFGECSLPPQGASQQLGPTGNSAGIGFQWSPAAFLFSKGSLRLWKILVSSAGGSINEIIVGLCSAQRLCCEQNLPVQKAQQPDSLQGKWELFRVVIEESVENEAFSYVKKKIWKWLIIPGRESNKNLHGKIVL